jgi:hypothetical protein
LAEAPPAAAMALRGASAFGRGAAEVRRDERASFRDARRGNASERGHQGRLYRNARQCQERPVGWERQGQHALREPQLDAWEAGRLRQAEEPVRQAVPGMALRVAALRRPAERAMALVAVRPRAALARPESRRERLGELAP